jgi:putative nucleotidyltransferase with HDIG domain
MNRLSIVADTVERARAINRQLVGLFEIQAFPRANLPSSEPSKYTVVDVDLIDGSRLSELRQWLTRRPPDGKAIFVVEPGIMRQAMQAFAIGATDLVQHPLNRRTLLTTLLGDLGSMASDPLPPSISNSAGAWAAVGALQGVFDAVFSGDSIEVKSVEAAGDVLVSDIEAEGLGRWIDVVRAHHSQTYQHCLLVTGIAVEFGRHLGFSRADLQTLAFAGLLHDVGKAGIPLAILEKPAPLSRDELSMMRQHPQLGLDSLRQMRGIDPGILDIVFSHHELLDGSGYPRGRAGAELSDLVRIITIADIYGALIEKRSYKAPMTPQAAYQVLEKMGPKLDADLVREFRACTRMKA